MNFYPTRHQSQLAVLAVARSSKIILDGQSQAVPFEAVEYQKRDDGASRTFGTVKGRRNYLSLNEIVYGQII